MVRLDLLTRRRECGAGLSALLRLREGRSELWGRVALLLLSCVFVETALLCPCSSQGDSPDSSAYEGTVVTHALLRSVEASGESYREGTAEEMLAGVGGGDGLAGAAREGT